MVNYASKRHHKWSELFQLIGWALIGILLIGLPPESVFANGAHLNSQVVYSGFDKEYSVRVQTVPVVGQIHLTAYLSNQLTTEPISNLPILISFGQNAEAPTQQSPMELLPIADQPGWYGIDIDMPQQGTWIFSLTIEDSTGFTTFEFPVDVIESTSAIWPIIGLVIIVLSLTLWIRYRSTQRKKASILGREL